MAYDSLANTAPLSIPTEPILLQSDADELLNSFCGVELLDGFLEGNHDEDLPLSTTDTDQTATKDQSTEGSIETTDQTAPADKSTTDPTEAGGESATEQAKTCETAPPSGQQVTETENKSGQSSGGTVSGTGLVDGASFVIKGVGDMSVKERNRAILDKVNGSFNRSGERLIFHKSWNVSIEEKSCEKGVKLRCSSFNKPRTVLAGERKRTTSSNATGCKFQAFLKFEPSVDGDSITCNYTTEPQKKHSTKCHNHELVPVSGFEAHERWNKVHEGVNKTKF